jgi:hypothetical protein
MHQNDCVKSPHDYGRRVRAVRHSTQEFSMNVKSIYETLTALGTSAMIVGCGAQQTPVNAAEDRPSETASESATKEASGTETDAPIASPALASPAEKPSTETTAASSPTPAGATPAGATPAGATPAGATPAPAAATAKPVPKKPATTTKTAGKKKDAGAACGEGGCG